MNYSQFSNLSCYEEFEIQCALIGISKIDVLKKIGDQIDDYYFFVSDDGVFNWFDLTGNHTEDPGVLKELKRYHIPKTISKCIIPDSVTSIGNRAFQDCYLLTSIAIPDSVTSIGNRAFAYCDLLKEITIPDGVTNIDDCAFSCCNSLSSIFIPNSVTSIGDGAFFYCDSLASITISNSVTNIGMDAFAYCKSLTSITIPDNITSIGDGAFFYCDSLKDIIFKGKTLDEVKQLKNYPFGIKDESIIKCEL